MVFHYEGRLSTNATPAPPSIFETPADGIPTLGSLNQDPALHSFRDVMAYERSMAVFRGHGTVWRSVRAWARRVSGRPTRRRLYSLAEATDAMARYCDELALRVKAETAVSADVSATLGQELALLRAEVHHLRSLVAVSDRSG
jgi:hypothetical protein